MVTTYEVGVWVTQALYNEGVSEYGDGYRARDRAATWIEGAFDMLADYDVDIVLGTETPYPPEECISCEMDGTYPCTNYAGTWQSSWYWWKDHYGASCTSLKSATDARILIFKGGGGGLGNGKYATVGTGSEILDLDSTYQEYGYQVRHKGMWVCLHELGHCLITGVEDKDGDGTGEHDSGEVQYDYTNSQYTITPMGLDGDENNCESNDYPKSYTDTDGDGKPDGWCLRWSSCAQSDFK